MSYAPACIMKLHYWIYKNIRMRADIFLISLITINNDTFLPVTFLLYLQKNQKHIQTPLTELHHSRSI